MSQFFKRFLTEEAPRLNSGGDRFVALGAFGKHPGWDDHIEDLGLETETLTLAKRLLYIQGVGGQIDTGAWEKLDPAHRLEGFNHFFVWQRSGQFLLGRLWSSSDGKGRTRYPMVLCAHCIGAFLDWGLEYVLPRLQELEQACKVVSTAPEVRALLDATRARLRAALPGAEQDTRFTPSLAEALRRFVADPALGPDHQGWFRIQYQVDNQMAAFKSGRFNPKGDLTALRPQATRLPIGANSPEQAVALWRRFFAGQLDRSVPLLMMVSPGETWVDVVLGEPSSQEFFCLRARPAVLPLATEVPYDLSESFKTGARELLARWQAGNPATPAAPAESTSGGGWVSVTQRWFKGKGAKLWLSLVLGVVVLGGLAVVWVSSSNRSSGPLDQAASVKPAASASSGDRASPAKSVAQQAPQAGVPDLSSKSEVPIATIPARQAQPEAQAKRLAEEEARRQELEKQRTAEIEAARRLAQIKTQDPVAAGSNIPVKVPSEPAQNPPPPTPVPVASNVPVQTEVVATQAVATPPVLAKAVPVLPRIVTNSIGMVLLWVAALPACANGGYVSECEVTQQQFEQVMKQNPSKSKNPLQPVESVTWEEAADFCRTLTALERERNTPPQALAYALPTEAQWEFFLADARFEDAITSRDRKELRETPAPVGSLPPNKLGLRDVLGNVWEFCSDPANSAGRLLHGGAFGDGKLFAERPGVFKRMERMTPRRLGPQERSADAGFRCVATPQP
jgi:hypothetical protein